MSPFILNGIWRLTACRMYKIAFGCGRWTSKSGYGYEEMYGSSEDDWSLVWLFRYEAMRCGDTAGFIAYSLAIHTYMFAFGSIIPKEHLYKSDWNRDFQVCHGKIKQLSRVTWNPLFLVIANFSIPSKMTLTYYGRLNSSQKWMVFASIPEKLKKYTFSWCSGWIFFH